MRERVDFLTLCKTPELAAEVTLQPLRRFGFDAAILFSDILVVPEALGQRLSFGEGEGPRLDPPLRSRADLARLHPFDPARETRYVIDAVRAIKAALPDGEALLGFAGAPFTLACYMTEGSGSTSFPRLRALLAEDPEAASSLLARLGDAVAGYLIAQLEAGADAVQLFDTWAGLLDAETYAARVAPHVRAIWERVRAAAPRAPRIYFAAQASHLLPRLGEIGADVVGIDWRLPLADARRLLPARVALQGNLDPALLLAAGPAAVAQAERILTAGDATPGHVFNLGHGVHPDTLLEQVAAVAGAVRAFASRHRTAAA
jgi:uroporphyrinogen decarboxylase